jgi:hypothetical protein
MIEPRPARTWLSGKELAKIRAMAIRRGNWYRTLSKTERALLDLTIRVVRKIRSFVLSRILAPIIEKLHVRTEYNITVLFHEIGKPLAEKISRIAQNWGNTSANSWSTDNSLAQFLAIMQINEPSIFMEEGRSS